jgi:hypothetical protein
MKFEKLTGKSPLNKLDDLFGRHPKITPEVERCSLRCSSTNPRHCLQTTMAAKGPLERRRIKMRLVNASVIRKKARKALCVLQFIDGYSQEKMVSQLSTYSEPLPAQGNGRPNCAR